MAAFFPRIVCTEYIDEGCCYRCLYVSVSHNHEPRKISWSDQDAVLAVDSCRRRNHMLDGSTYGRHLANMMEWSMHDSIAGCGFHYYGNCFCSYYLLKDCLQVVLSCKNVKKCKWLRYYRALESVSIASALSTALTIYTCQIRVHQCWQSKLQLPTARKKEWRPATAGSSPVRLPVNTVLHTTLVGLEPATSGSLIRRATSSATDSPVSV